MKVIIHVFVWSFLFLWWTMSVAPQATQPATGAGGNSTNGTNETTPFDYSLIDEVTPPPPVETTEKPTPLLLWSGKQTWATFESEGTECWNQSSLYRVIRSGKPPEEKTKILDEYGCRVEWGLECLNSSDPNSHPIQYRYACRCALQLGPSPAVQPEDQTKSQCYIPAGKGYASECWDPTGTVTKRGQPFTSIGFPYPYGDPAGPGPDPPYLTDILDPESNKGVKRKSVVRYVGWNSRYLRCVPFSECREGSKYFGKRCQCYKNATFNQRLGTCSDGTQLFRFSFIINLAFVSFLYRIF